MDIQREPTFRAKEGSSLVGVAAKWRGMLSKTSRRSLSASMAQDSTLLHPKRGEAGLLLFSQISHKCLVLWRCGIVVACLNTTAITRVVHLEASTSHTQEAVLKTGKADAAQY